MWNRINKKERIQQWIDWVDIEVEIRQPQWGQHIPRGWYEPDNQKIVINGKQDEKEIIKSIIHEVSHWINNDQVNDPDKWEREDRCVRCEDQWKVEPDEVVWE